MLKLLRVALTSLQYVVRHVTLAEESFPLQTSMRMRKPTANNFGERPRGKRTQLEMWERVGGGGACMGRMLRKESRNITSANSCFLRIILASSQWTGSE